METERTYPGHRLVVVGTTGCGKTTLAQQLASRLGYPHIELDSLYWGPDWSPRPDFSTQVEQATQGTHWVADGNYRRQVQTILWDRADTLIWLDYSLGLILWRLARRTVRRVVLREELWNGNHESLLEQIFSADSLFRYAIDTHRPRRMEYATVSDDPRWQHLHFIRLRTPRNASRWLSALVQSQGRAQLATRSDSQR